MQSRKVHSGKPREVEIVHPCYQPSAAELREDLRLEQLVVKLPHSTLPSQCAFVGAATRSMDGSWTCCPLADGPTGSSG